jgi:CRISPR-associated protein Csx10
MKCALILLTAREPAIFTERAATEGQHRTLLHPSGSALLGWAAGEGRYAAFKDAAYTIFHSGHVRFSNALPVAPTGEVAYPIPMLLTMPKYGSDGIKLETVRVGHPPNEIGKDGNPIQREALKGVFITLSGETIVPRTAGRLRTATRDGRAAAGQLFGYTHLDPSEAPGYVATIEADDDAVTATDWSLLLDAFFDRVLRLGRAAGTSYGGAYDCQLLAEEAAETIWPKPGDTKGAGRIRVWALTDLALVDRLGAPSFAPTSEMLGLPPDGIFCGSESAVATRRYAQWNRILDARDIERQVVAAGSVFTFRYSAGAPEWPCRSVVGLGREAGLGRIWVAPPILGVSDTEGAKPFIVETAALPFLRRAAPLPATVAPAERSGELLGWLDAMTALDAAERKVS